MSDDLYTRTLRSAVFEDCWTCARALSKKLADAGHWAESLSFGMYLCSECGSKRCAKAENHDSACDKGAAEIERLRLANERHRAEIAATDGSPEALAALRAERVRRFFEDETP